MHLSRMKKIKDKARFVLENLPESTDIDTEEIKIYMSEIIGLADECFAILNGVEFDLLELLRKIRQ